MPTVMSANQKAAVTCHTLTPFTHTEALQLLLLRGEAFGTPAA